LTNSDLTKLKLDRSGKRDRGLHRNRRHRHFVPALVVLLALAGAFGAFSIWFSSAIPVRVARVQRTYPSQALTVLNATGYVVPQTKADVASKGTGRLEWMEVREGSKVKKGEIIARLESQDVVATMHQAAANVTVAKAALGEAEAEEKDARLRLARAKKLIGKHFVSEQDYDAALARHDKAVAGVESAKAAILAARAAYDAAEVAVEYTLIRAPFDGVILSKHADIGDVVAPFSSTTESKGAVVSMADMDTLEVEADVSESNLLKVAIGQPCEVELDAVPDERFRCAVHRIVPTVDRSKATVMVKVRFIDKDRRILPDMSAKVAFLSRELAPDERQAITAVPAAAVTSRDGRDTVFVVESSRVRAVPLANTTTIGDMHLVGNALKAGDRVVLEPPATLQDGSEIEVIES
jgi:RND family efflux transporter MFP subunit